ncbi:hypothetical protein BsIDN1_29250 [Bacillus safensis]|uniref:Uncharacterized protein n=1 Tax=Bacillus safensis TaxID=561879 RepID=A0A5S9M724_BACIA|nr:hypothetical protein BsIDN1_29250 [Bacillus safensis]
MTYNFDLSDFWCVYRECTLNAYTVRDLTNCESFADSTTTTLNYNTFKDLDTLTSTLDNFNVYT